MIPSLLIIGLLVVVGTILWLHDRYRAGKMEQKDRDPSEREPMLSSHREDSPVCCGMHITCEKDSLSTAASTEIVYYDDEELDRFAGRPADGYDTVETEEFRNVLLTLLPHDIAGWGRSLQLRGIDMPSEVKDELIMIVSEERSRRNVAAHNA